MHWLLLKAQNGDLCYPDVPASRCAGCAAVRVHDASVESDARAVSFGDSSSLFASVTDLSRCGITFGILLALLQRERGLCVGQ